MCRAPQFGWHWLLLIVLCCTFSFSSQTIPPLINSSISITAGDSHYLELIQLSHGAILSQQQSTDITLYYKEYQPFVMTPLCHYLWAKQQQPFSSQPLQNYSLITTVFHRTSYALLSFKDKNIHSIEDLQGKRIGIYDGFQMFLLNNTIQTMLQRRGIQPAAIDMVAPSIYTLFEQMLLFDSYDTILVRHNYEVYEPYWLLHNGVTTYYQPEDFDMLFLDDEELFSEPVSACYKIGLFVHNDLWANSNALMQQQLNQFFYSLVFCRKNTTNCFHNGRNLNLHNINYRLYNGGSIVGNVTVEELKHALEWSNQLNITHQFSPSTEQLNNYFVVNASQVMEQVYSFILQQQHANLTQEDLFFYWSDLAPICNHQQGTWLPMCNGIPDAYTIFFMVQTIIHFCLMPISILLTIFNCTNVKKQPTKSRFIAPFVGNFFFSLLNFVIAFACLFSALRYTVPRWMTISLKMNPEFFAATIAETFVLIAVGYGVIFITYLIQTIRYFYIKSFYKTLLKQLVSPTFIKLNRYLTSNAAYILITIILSLVYALIILPFMIIGNSNRDTVDENVAGIGLAVGFIIVVIVITYIAFVVDALLRAKELLVQCKWQWFFFEDDPLLFRLESLFFGPTVVVGFIMVIVFAIDSNIEYTYSLVMMLIFFNLFNLLILFVFCGGLLLIMQCITSCTTRKFKYQLLREDAVEDDSQDRRSFVVNQKIEELLKDSNGHKMVSDYAAGEFSLENVLFYDELQKVEEELQKPSNSMNIDNLKQRLQDLKKKFIAKNSIYEVNMSFEAKNMFEETIKLLENLQLAVQAPVEVQQQEQQNLSPSDVQPSTENLVSPTSPESNISQTPTETASDALSPRSGKRQSIKLNDSKQRRLSLKLNNKHHNYDWEKYNELHKQFVDSNVKMVIRMKKEVMVNIVDTLSRLEKTPKYKRFTKALEVNKQMMKNANISV